MSHTHKNLENHQKIFYKKQFQIPEERDNFKGRLHLKNNKECTKEITNQTFHLNEIMLERLNHA